MTEEQKKQMRDTRAFDWVSFDPEKRIETFIREYAACEQEMLDLCNQYEIEFSKFKEKHFKLAMNYLYSQSRCISWAITGPANFPVARAEKRHNSCEAHLNTLVDFRNNFEKLLKRITRRSETEDDKKTKWVEKIEKLKNLQEMMKDVNKLIRQGKQAEAEEKYNIKLEKNCWGNIGFESYELRNNLANIKRLEEQIKQIDRARENKAETGFEFDGGRVEFDSEEIRYNIFFDTIPEVETRSKLKSYGFKWSPRRSAWTRGAKTIRIETIKMILNV